MRRRLSVHQQLLPPLLPLQLARPFLLAFEWATRHPPVLHNLPTLGIGDIKWAGTMAPLETARCKINLLLDKGSGGQEQRPCPRQRTEGHPPTRLEVHPDLHQFTGALDSLLVHQQRARWSPGWWQTRSGALLAPRLTHGSKQVAA